MTMELAKEYAQNILNVLQKGQEPPITKVHLARLPEKGIPPMMPQQFRDQIKPFDAAKCNQDVTGMLGKGFIRVEKIATCMSSVMTTCVAEVEHMPKIVEGMVMWAKPIIEANALKGAVCTAWRKQLESDHVVAPQQMMHAGQMIVSAKQLKEMLLKQGSRAHGMGSEEDEEENEDEDCDSSNEGPTVQSAFRLPEDSLGPMMHLGNLYRAEKNGTAEGEEEGSDSSNSVMDITHLMRKLTSSSPTTTTAAFSSTAVEASNANLFSASRLVSARNCTMPRA